MYEKGLGVPQDYRKALEWYTKAAKQGNMNGQMNLGLMYEHGRAVKQDYAAAYDWYQKAAQQGNADAASHAESIKPKLDAQRQQKESVTIRVVNSNWVNITSADENGYKHVGSGPLQPMVVSLGTATGEHGIALQGMSFGGGNARADIVCLGGYDGHGNPKLGCPPLAVGSTYNMDLGRVQTHMTPDGAGGYDYKNLPYLSMKRRDGSLSAWQILELCHGEHCVAVSTINSR